MPTPSDAIRSKTESSSQGQSAVRPKWLILGGTEQAAALAARLVNQGEVEVVTSLAGRTSDPAPLAGAVRIGGFGGIDGLVRYLRENDIAQVIDATHPFATRISRNAVAACGETGISLQVLDRPEWRRQPGDDWREVASLEAAATALPAGAKIFLALGRQYLQAFAARTDCHFVVRMIDPPATPLPFARFDLLLGRASADAGAEAALFERHHITHLVCRNSGGEAGYGKVLAARELGLPVVMLGRTKF